LCVLNVTVDTVTVARIPDEAAIETRFKNRIQYLRRPKISHFEAFLRVLPNADLLMSHGTECSVTTVKVT